MESPNLMEVQSGFSASSLEHASFAAFEASTNNRRAGQCFAARTGDIVRAIRRPLSWARLPDGRDATGLRGFV